MDNGITAGVITGLVGLFATALVARDALALGGEPVRRSTLIVLTSFAAGQAVLGFVVALLAAAMGAGTPPIALLAPLAALCGGSVIVLAARRYTEASAAPGKLDLVRLRGAAIVTAAFGQGLSILGVVVALLAVFGIFA